MVYTWCDWSEFGLELVSEQNWKWQWAVSWVERGQRVVSAVLLFMAPEGVTFCVSKVKLHCGSESLSLCARGCNVCGVMCDVGVRWIGLYLGTN